MPAPASPDAPASHAPPVRALLDRIRARRLQTEADRQLARRLHVAFERLSATNEAVRGLHFYVFEGAVSVYGAVPTSAQRDEVLATVAALPGVTHIADHLTAVAE